MSFLKYPHIERLGHDEVEGILDGWVFISPKLDGSNGSIWKEKESIACGSRNHKLSVESTNKGFYTWVQENQQKFSELFGSFPNWHLFGEWLVPHTFHGYKKEAWNQFYVFDVWNTAENSWIPIAQYEKVLSQYEINYIPAIKAIYMPLKEDMGSLLEENIYLCEEGKGPGEGIVIRNYSFINQYGHCTWAKLVRPMFRTKKSKQVSFATIEDLIGEKHFPESIVQKVFANIVARDGWKMQKMPELLGRVWHDFITEELWVILKSNKNPVIDFRQLKKAIEDKTKSILEELL